MTFKITKLNSEKILFCLSIILLLVSASYFIKGFYTLVIFPRGAKDLFERWLEQQYIYLGQYPYDAREGSSNVITKLGPVVSGGYPPWAFFTGFFLVARLPWQITRLYFAFVNLISIFIVALFSYKIGSPYGKSKALFSLSAILAISTHTTTLNNGQYGIIINALLICFYWCLEKRQYIWAGLALGLAMIKPNISGLYLFILLVHKRINAILSFTIYIIFANIYIWILVKETPIYMINHIIDQSQRFADRGGSGINILTNLGIDPKLATIVLGLLGIVIVTIIFYFWRNYSLLTLFAIASVIGRVCTYHQFYDNVMLIFLLLALIKITFDKPQTLNILILTLVAATLWIPRSMIHLINAISIYEVTQLIIWTIALIYLLVYEKRNSLEANR